MRRVNLLSIVNANELSDELFNKYKNLHKIQLSTNEFSDLKSFVAQIRSRAKQVHLVEGFYLGYSIPQISKEFDLLRIGEKAIINVELKRESTEQKIFKQLERNYYYLSFLDRKVFCYTYVSSQEKLYSLDAHGNVVERDFNDLCYLLDSESIEYIQDINSLFDPSNYLVSPFNSTDKFVEGAYFLTHHQEEIKYQVITECKKTGSSFASIYGKAGTGKTLLAYDIVKSLSDDGYRALVIHCGKLNNGHHKLNSEYGWDIIPIRSWATKDLTQYKLILIDEVQRIYPSQLNLIVSKVKASKGNCIFSYDGQQWLREWEKNNDIESKIEEIASPNKYRLTEKIRTNKEIANFIKALFKSNVNTSGNPSSNIEIIYFKSTKNAKDYASYLAWNNWKVINFTPSKGQSLKYNEYHIISEDNAHEVIGQEFDNVVATIDEHFGYENNELSTSGYSVTPYYHPSKMLFQILTRTRRKLCIIIVNNETVLNRCISILGG